MSKMSTQQKQNQKNQMKTITILTILVRFWPAGWVVRKNPARPGVNPGKEMVRLCPVAFHPFPSLGICFPPAFQFPAFLSTSFPFWWISFPSLPFAFHRKPLGVGVESKSIQANLK